MSDSEKKRGNAIFILFLISIVIHIADIFLRFGGNSYKIIHFMLVPYFLMPLLALFFLGKELKWENIKVYFALSAWAYLIPMLNYAFYYFPQLNITSSLLGISARVIFSIFILSAPAWPLYLAFKESTSTTRFFGIIYMFGWAVVIIMTLWGPISETVLQTAELPGIQPGLTISLVIQYIIHGAQTLQVGVLSVQEKVTQEIKNQIYIAKTGTDQTRATIDASNKGNPGVELTDMAASSNIFYEGDQITVYAKIKAETLKQPVTMRVECIATSDPVYGTIFPSNEFTVDIYDIYDIDCIFPKDELLEGLHTVKLNTAFNFETASYLETFFMNEETLRELQKNEQDPLAGYPAPEAISSKGPVNINIKTPEAPLPSSPDKKITASITMHNTGGGTIKRLNALYIFVPKGLELSYVDQRGIYEKIECDQLPPEEAMLCNPETTTVYQVSPAELQKEIYKNIALSREFRLYLEISDYGKVLGNSIIKPGNFYASAKYDYEMQQSIPVRVQKTPEI